MKNLIKIFIILSLFLLLNVFSSKAQEYSLKSNNIESILTIKPSSNDNILTIMVYITNNSSDKIYIPHMDKTSLNYHYFFKEKSFYCYCGIKENFWGPMNLGAWIRLKEIFPKKTVSFLIDVPVDNNISNVKEIMYMFEYLPNIKKINKQIKTLNGEIIISGEYYWENCIDIYSSFKWNE